MIFRMGCLFVGILVLNSCVFESKVQQKNTLESDFDFYPTSTTGVVIQHPYFALSYSEEHEQAEWVAYKLTSFPMGVGNYERPYFNEDPKVKTRSAHWRNYKNSGYDKGHLCPAGDMKFSKEAFESTFLTSNVSPQLPQFNSGIWNRLEQKVRYWSQKYTTLYVVTGGVLTSDLLNIGFENVAVPNYFYKIVFIPTDKNPMMVGFLIPHKEASNSIFDFVVSVDEIERVTGIDFFPTLEDELEEKLEQNSTVLKALL